MTMPRDRERSGQVDRGAMWRLMGRGEMEIGDGWRKGGYLGMFLSDLTSNSESVKMSEGRANAQCPNSLSLDLLALVLLERCHVLYIRCVVRDRRDCRKES